MILYFLLMLLTQGTSMHRPRETLPCLMVDTAAICRNISLKLMPLDLQPSIQTLDLSDNDLQNITRDSLIYYSSLENLNLHSNKISFIERHTFEKMVNLQRISLANNSLGGFLDHGVKGIGMLPKVRTLDLSHNGLYNEMTNYFLEEAPLLQYLSLSENSITTVSSGMFAGSPYLVEVDLHNNIIMDIEEGSFDHLKHLSKINLSMNSITCVSDFNLQQLNVLNLSKNSIKYFHATDSDGKYQLEYIDLSHNKLSSFPHLPRVNSLIHIDLSNNYIDLNTRSPDDKTGWVNYSSQHNFFSTVPLPKLTHLDLSYNSIKSAPEMFFMTMPSLLLLNLSKNCIDEFSWGDPNVLKSLTVLDLSENSMQGLSLVVNSFPSLQELHLQYNQLFMVEHNIFQRLKSISTINLQGNQVQGLCSVGDKYGCVSFFNISTLQHLNLRENMIGRVPQQAFLGSSLTLLDLAMNENISMETNALIGLEKTLEKLFMEGNRLSSLNVDLPRFSYVTYLNLSRNTLSWLPEWNVDSRLEVLDLSQNHFTDLQVSNIPVLERTLKILSLYGNPLSCCANSWVSYIFQRTTVTIVARNLTMCNISKAHEEEITIEQINYDLCKKDLKKTNIIIIVLLVLVVLAIGIGITLFWCFCRNKLNRKFKA
ncbi:hypothetical protein GDO86_019112 [Hymenochirus boettgeri]|uniref:Uncharacterized protein n=1 Tax=Hymenochirus boettgeri TaxID=247094 RepID=A0A8T2IMC4_9PIPI|nr:hypothetical protein GDO86_019112 [Hymenochirus boettgeri]